ncbi:hypothetical protein NUW58_g7922 [Xylaria curta]|uniref:Uncharacterized protein n=1 Tax=Xylaria curta TaxID=42375 RepID=A0ACC1NEM0_9PEZI|nr:hypothetical protein NUW58_g7922 [Xylaria curta]
MPPSSSSSLGARGLPLDLSFEIFEIAVLILAIITVGNYLRDQKSDYLEGFLCVITYIAIAVAAFYFPTPPEPTDMLGVLGPRAHSEI